VLSLVNEGGPSASQSRIGHLSEARLGITCRACLGLGRYHLALCPRPPESKHNDDPIADIGDDLC
jgi:hypothetical protein